jgi:hypothetical protein
MPYGTATQKLRKMILFKLVQELDLDWCYQCGNKIENIKNLSIEHKKPWLDSDNPIENFFNLNNIAFSHLKCNISAARQTRTLKHPSLEAYYQGCRCPKCTEIQRIHIQEYRKGRKERDPMYRRKVIPTTICA